MLNISSYESRKILYGYDEKLDRIFIDFLFVFRYLFLRELYRKRRQENVASNDLRRAQSAKRRAQLLSEGQQPTNYPGYKTIFRHLGRKSEKYLRDQLLSAPGRLGEFVVIDCGFEEEHVREYYLTNLVDQVQYLFADVTRYHSPSFVYLCNLSSTGRLQTEFQRRAPLNNMCFETTASSYLDVFPKEKLIYLSPDSNVEMNSFDHDAIYIIGGIADLSKEKEKVKMYRIFVSHGFLAGKKPLTFAKAKRENLQHQRLPLDRYVKFVESNVKREMFVDFFLDSVVEVEKV